MICKGCQEEVDQVSGAGFCSKGVCSIMESGYLLGLQDVNSHMAEQARVAQRVTPISVVPAAPASEPRGEMRELGEVRELKRANAWP